MARPGIHPMRSLVRIVFTNGASTVTSLAGQRPYPGLSIATKFLENDFFTDERYTGIPSKSKQKIGRRAQFENRFKQQ